jgi:hypothetical protein
VILLVATESIAVRPNNAGTAKVTAENKTINNNTDKILFI